MTQPLMERKLVIFTDQDARGCVCRGSFGEGKEKTLGSALAQIPQGQLRDCAKRCISRFRSNISIDIEFAIGKTMHV